MNNVYLKVPDHDVSPDSDEQNGRRRLEALEIEEDNDYSPSLSNENDEEMENNRMTLGMPSQRPARAFQSTEQSDPLSKPDAFCETLYKYYHKKGWWCILFEKLTNIIQIYVIVTISFCLLLFVNYRDLLSCNMEECGKINIFAWPSRSFTTYVSVTVHLLLYLGALVITMKDLFRLIDYYRVHVYVTQDLQLAVGQVQTMAWSDLLNIVVDHSRNHKKIFIKDHNKLAITNRIMRIENIMVELISNDVIPLYMHRWLGNVLSKSLVKNLRYILSSLRYNENWTGLKLDNPGKFRLTIVKTGIYNMLLAPFIAYYIIMNTILKYAAELKKGKLNFLTLQRWSNLAKWKFRCFNELPHDFKNRMNASLKPARDYYDAFPMYGLSIVAKGLVNVASAFIAVLILLSFLKNAALIYINIFGLNLLYWMGLLFMIWATSSSFVIPFDENVPEADESMDKLIKVVYTVPNNWQQYPKSPRSYVEFCGYFQKSFKYFFHEMISIFVVPLYLIFVLSGDAEKILNHLSSMVYRHEVVGDIIYFSNFEEDKQEENSDNDENNVSPPPTFTDHGNMHRKMLASQINFKLNNRKPSPPSSHSEAVEGSLLAELEQTFVI